MTKFHAVLSMSHIDRQNPLCKKAHTSAIATVEDFKKMASSRKCAHCANAIEKLGL